MKTPRMQYNGLVFLLVIFSCLPFSLPYRAKLNSSIHTMRRISNVNVFVKPSGGGYEHGGHGGGKAKGSSTGGYASLSPARSTTSVAGGVGGGATRWVFFDYDETLTKTSNVVPSNVVPKVDLGIDLSAVETSSKNLFDKHKNYLWFLFGSYEELPQPQPGGLPNRVGTFYRYLPILQSNGVRTAVLSKHRLSKGGSGMTRLVIHLKAAGLDQFFDEIWVKSEDGKGYDKWEGENNWPQRKKSFQNFVAARKKQDAMKTIAHLGGTVPELMVLVDDDQANLDGLTPARKGLANAQGAYGFSVSGEATDDQLKLTKNLASEQGFDMKAEELKGFASAQVGDRETDFPRLMQLFGIPPPYDH